MLRGFDAIALHGRPNSILRSFTPKHLSLPLPNLISKRHPPTSSSSSSSSHVSYILLAYRRLEQSAELRRAPALTMRSPHRPCFLALPVLLLLLLIGAVLSASAAASSGKALGGWTPIKDVNDPHVLEIAQFAVSEHNKQANSGLALDKVVKGETQVVSGANYRLVLSASDGSGASARYEAVVWEKPWEKFRQLTSFKKLVNS
ncbi:hypothetical protein OPV22_014404 [Ensete ventricosum]|uniref:Cystatin domain-containing protein n=1 Tax=Ensete ventricosum TaxID=4639 RepID=A0AAV8PK91_ENSVE|nr:hypothetical protein OPV22_014404 [Ensete ventricosum]